MLYSEFSIFSKDQEHLISLEDSFDYIEGFVIINRTGLLNNWRSSFNPRDPLQASHFSSDGKTLYCLEMAIYFNPDDTETMNEVRLPNYFNHNDGMFEKSIIPNPLFVIMQKTERLIPKLSFIPSTLFMSEVSLVDFLDRVHVSEMKLREKGLWEVPHPWLNLLVPKTKISYFAQEVFGNILTENNNGPILIYPVNKSRYQINQLCLFFLLFLRFTFSKNLPFLMQVEQQNIFCHPRWKYILFGGIPVLRYPNFKRNRQFGTLNNPKPKNSRLLCHSQSWR